MVGIRHPLQHLHGNAIRSLRGQGLQVDVVGEDLKSKIMEVRICLSVNNHFILRDIEAVHLTFANLLQLLY